MRCMHEIHLATWPPILPRPLHLPLRGILAVTRAISHSKPTVLCAFVILKAPSQGQLAQLAQVLISFAISSRSSCKSSSLILSANEGIKVLHSSALSQQREPVEMGEPSCQPSAHGTREHKYNKK
jgi:hypothetical protein